VVLGPFQKDEPQLSYDGKWLAYTTNQSGTFQVYVRSFPAGDQIIPISTNGGGQPRWRRDGKELFYRVESATMAVEISAGAKLEAGVPRQLFGPIITGTQDRDPTRRPWVIHPDGQRFLMRVALGQGGQADGRGGAPGIGFAVNVAQVAAAGQEQGVVASGLTVIRNWPAAFRKAPQ